jgi:hypothetical protein
MRTDKPLNGSVWTETFTCLVTPWGGETVGLNGVELVRYSADPDAFAAEHFGMTKDEYRLWVLGSRRVRQEMTRRAADGY